MNLKQKIKESSIPNAYHPDAPHWNTVTCSVAEPDPVEPK